MCFPRFPRYKSRAAIVELGNFVVPVPTWIPLQLCVCVCVCHSLSTGSPPLRSPPLRPITQAFPPSSQSQPWHLSTRVERARCTRQTAFKWFLCAWYEKFIISYLTKKLMFYAMRGRRSLKFINISSAAIALLGRFLWGPISSNKFVGFGCLDIVFHRPV